MNESKETRTEFGSRADREAVETALVFAPKFDADGLIPVVAVDHRSGGVLMVAYMSEEALRRTLALGEVVYFSRSRKELWHKGATSGHVQKVREILTDCDQDTLVIKVEQVGPGCCHAGYQSCFYRKVPLADEAGESPYPLRQVAEQTYNPKTVYSA